VVDVEVAASLARKQQGRVRAVPDPLERLERPQLEWYGPRARFRLRHLQLAAGEGTADIDDSLVSVNIAFLEGDPFGGP
jgi:hypothetical protein